MIADVYQEIGISKRNIFYRDLENAHQILKNQLGFESEPDLVDHHRGIIRQLLDRAKDR